MDNKKITPITRINKFFSEEDFELEISMVVYKTTNLINGKIYVGQDSKNNPEYLGSGTILKRAIKKYGKENFKKEILEECYDKDELDEKEKYWIKELNSIEDGYNITKGGDGCLGCKQSEETKEKRRLKNIGEKNPMFGKKLSEESLAKRSEKVKREGTYSVEKNGNFKYKLEKKDLYNLFIIENKTIKDISKLYGCSIDVVNDNLRKFKINKEKTNKYNLNIKEINNYLSNNMNLVQIGLIYGCSNKIIHKFIKKHKNGK
jgi:group I intron endonuclease